MNQIKYHRVIVTGVIVLLLTATNGYLISSATHDGMSAEMILTIRGMTCCLLAILFAWRGGLPLRPNSPKTQLVRGLLAASSIFLVTLSYRYLHPSTATLIGRIDIPMLGILTIKNVRNSRKSKAFGLLAIIWCFITALYLRDPQESLVGYLYAGLGGTLVAVGYIFVHRSSKAENHIMLPLTPAVACVVLGVCLLALNQRASLPSTNALMATIASGIIMFAAYQIIRVRHLSHSAMAAELPSAFVPLFLATFESLVLHKLYSVVYVLALLVGAILIVSQLLLGRKSLT